ncbi:MAG: RDD family protein [Eubacteriales bacterium]|nr:RDD family protein [Eubacteriales bacterium]
MKRIGSYFIDFIVISIILGLSRDPLFNAIHNFNVLWIIYFFAIYLYFWLSDMLFHGSSIGKRLMKMDIVLKDNSLLAFATLHSLLKMAFSFIWVITIVIYLAGHKKMPYDKLFYERIE